MPHWQPFFCTHGGGGVVIFVLTPQPNFHHQPPSLPSSMKWLLPNTHYYIQPFKHIIKREGVTADSNVFLTQHYLEW